MVTSDDREGQPGQHLTGVLREERAAFAVDNLLDHWTVGGSRWRWDQVDPRHHGAQRRDESQAGVEPLDTQRVLGAE